MELNSYFKSIVEQDRCAVVICDLNHTMIYMNPAAIKNYQKRGGEALIGQSLFDCHNSKSNELIVKIVEWFKESKEHNIIYTSYNEAKNRDVYVVALRDENQELIGYYEKHEFRNRETEKPYQFVD
jgi:PAS domain-containing protein